MIPNIASLPIGAAAVVVDVQGLDPVVLRLKEMGLVEGARIVLTRRAPFGDPLELVVRGTRLVLRKEEAARFGVRVDE
jgi:ferrous iron transport protein A